MRKEKTYFLIPCRSQFAKFVACMIAILLLFSCGNAGRKVKEEVNESVSKAKNEIKKTWSDVIDKAMEWNADKSTKHTTFKQCFPAAQFTVTETEGLWADMPMGFYFCFLKYKTDKSQLLNYISSLETKLPDISDAAIKATDSTRLGRNLQYIEQEYPKLKEKLSFFYELRSIKMPQYFECSKYPNIHYIAFDPETKTVYHHFEKYWD